MTREGCFDWPPILLYFCSRLQYILYLKGHTQSLILNRPRHICGQWCSNMLGCLEGRTDTWVPFRIL